MIEGLVSFLETNVLPWGTFGVFVASVTEEVLAPIPSALIMTVSGFLLVSGPLGFNTFLALIFKVAIPAALGVTLGSYFIYFVSRFGGKILIDKWGKYLGLYWSDIDKIKNKFSDTKKDELLIILARIIPFVPSVAISAFCGVIAMNYKKYFLLTFCGTFFRGLILGALGWQVGNLYQKYVDFVQKIESYVLYTFALSLLIFIVVKFAKRK